MTDEPRYAISKPLTAVSMTFSGADDAMVVFNPPLTMSPGVYAVPLDPADVMEWAKQFQKPPSAQ